MAIISDNTTPVDVARSARPPTTMTPLPPPKPNNKKKVKAAAPGDDGELATAVASDGKYSAQVKKQSETKKSER